MQPFKFKSRPDGNQVVNWYFNSSTGASTHLTSREYIRHGTEKYGVNFCEHLRFQQSLHPYSGYGTTVTNDRVSPLVTCYSTTPTTILSVISSGEKPDMRAIAMAKVGAKANSFSMLNFLNELDELPSVLTGKILLDPITKGTRKKVRRTKVIRDLGRIAPNLYLANAFAIGPLINDIASFGSSIEVASRSLKTANNLIATPTRFFGSRHNFIDFNQRINDYLILRVYGTAENSVGGTLYGSLDMSPEMYRLKSLLDAAGVYVDGAVVWEALPFSFLVDYVLPIGNWLENARNPWVMPTIHSRDCWEITKVQVRFELEWNEPGYWKDPIGHVMATGTLKYFVRNHVQSIDVTPKEGFPQIRLPSARQGVTSLALGLDKFFP